MVNASITNIRSPFGVSPKWPASGCGEGFVSLICMSAETIGDAAEIDPFGALRRY